MVVYLSLLERRRLQRARGVERQPREEITRHQAALLVPTVRAALRSPFWQRHFAQAGFAPESLDHPDKLYEAPTIDKNVYFTALAADPEGYGGLLCRPLEEIQRRGAIVYRTSGTSGKQGRFINSHEGFNVFGAQGAAMLAAAGALPGALVLSTLPLTFWGAGWGLHYAARIGQYVLLPGGAPADTRARLGIIQEYRPAVVVATPSYAVTLGRAAAEAGLDLRACGVRGLLIGGETFSATKRALIEDLWHLPGGTRNFYGISEGGPLFAVECAAQNGMHLFEGDAIHQFWRVGDDEPAAPGEVAEHVFTSISQRTMATSFNFRTRDGATYSDEPCACRRTTRRMWIAERLDDMVKVKGINIFASAVEELLAPVRGVGEEFRLRIDRVREHDHLTLQLELWPACSPTEVERLVLAKMRDAFGVTFAVEFLTPDTLPKTELKARRWLDNRPKD